MKARPRFLLLAACGLASFGLGALCARSWHPPVSPAPPAAPASAPTAMHQRHERTVDDIFGEIAPAILEKDDLVVLRSLGAALEGMREDQAVPLLDRLYRLPERDRERLLHPVFAWLCARYPGAVTPWVLRFPRVRNPWLGSWHEDGGIFRTWASRVPEAALPVALADPLAFAHAFRQLSHPGKDESEPATIGFDALPPGPLRERAAALYLRSAYRDVSGAWRVAAREIHGDLRIDAVFGLANEAISLYEADPAALLAMLAQLAPALQGGPSGHGPLNEIAARATGRLGAEEVAGWVLRLPEALRVPTAVAVAQKWAQEAPLGALAWVRANGVELDYEIEHPEESSGRCSVLQIALKHAPEPVIEWLASLPPGAERDRLITYACSDRRLNAKQQSALRAAAR